MKIAGTSIAAYYAGNAAMGVDSQAARKARETNQISHLLKTTHSLKEVKPPRSQEQVLEGELLDGRYQKKTLDQGISGETFFARHKAAAGTLSSSQTNKAIAQYNDNAQLDGFADAKPLRQLDIFV